MLCDNEHLAQANQSLYTRAETRKSSYLLESDEESLENARDEDLEETEEGEGSHIKFSHMTKGEMARSTLA